MTIMTPLPTIEPAELRQTLGCFPTGVAIVTTMTDGGDPIGLAISSFNSVSMNPPLILWSLALKAASLPVFRASDGFVINVLSADQSDLPNVFSTPVDDRFSGLSWHRGILGDPVLKDAAAVIECKTYARYDGGDHEIILGEVKRHSSTDLIPLVYGKGRLSPLQVSP
jgi:flavin reductase (DIM6/NTAB) family NADH-FMN oxidoreductase RutF